MIQLCYFSLDQWELKIHLLWGKYFNITHWLRSHSTNRRLQHIEEISKSKTRIQNRHGLVKGTLFWGLMESLNVARRCPEVFSNWLVCRCLEVFSNQLSHTSVPFFFEIDCGTLGSLNDDTKILTETDTETFFTIPNFPKPKPILFFREQIFRNRNRDFFSDIKFSETGTFFSIPNFPKPKPILFFQDKILRNRYFFFETNFSET